jgi:hypothetical protein
VEAVGTAIANRLASILELEPVIGDPALIGLTEAQRADSVA